MPIYPKRKVIKEESFPNDTATNKLLGLESFVESSATVPYKEDMSIPGFYKSWINSSTYKDRLTNNGYKDPNKTLGNRLSSLNNVELEMNSNYDTQASPAVNRKSKSYININPNDLKKERYDTLAAHEYSHITGARPFHLNKGLGLSKKEQGMINSYNKNPSKNYHDRAPEELKADLDSVRYEMFKKGMYDIRKGVPFQKEDLKRNIDILNKNSSFKRLFDQTGEDNFIEMMNTIASNKNTTNTHGYIS